jgi:predicted DNA-binding protein
MISKILARNRGLKTVSVRLPSEFIEKLDSFCEENNYSRQRVLKEFLERGADQVMNARKETKQVHQNRPTILGDIHVYNPDKFIS